MRMSMRIAVLLAAVVSLSLIQACKKTQSGAEQGAAAAPKKPAQPKIVPLEKAFNFGKVKEGTEVEHVYKIKNEGDAELVIQNVRTSCGCTVAEPSTKNVPPGQESEIKATFKTAGRSGKTRKTITVTTNDPTTPTVVLSIEGEVESDVTVTPRSVWLGQLQKREKGKAEFSVKVSEPERIKIASITIEDKLFSFKKLEGDAKGDARYELNFAGSVKLGPISTAILVAYEGAEGSPARIPVRVEVVSDLQYTKYLRFIKKGDSFPPMTIIFKSRTDKPVTIKSANDPSKLLKLTIEEATGARPLIRAEVADPTASYETPKRNNIVVKTSDKDEPTVEIGYTIADGRGPIGPMMSPRPGGSVPAPPPPPAK